MEPVIPEQADAVADINQPTNRRQWLRRVGGTVLGSTIGLGLYAWRIEPHWVETVYREMPIVGLPKSLESRTLVQISDIHIGREVDDEFLIEWFQRVALWKPDIVVFTGDFLTLNSDRSIPTKQMEKVLAHFPKGALATIGILGNHDYGIGWASIDAANHVTAVAENAGMTILRNRTFDVEGLQIVGFDDFWGPNYGGKSVLKGVDLNRSTLCLCHNPDVADQPVWSGYRGWILSGHTHGGQCKLPFCVPPKLPLRNRRYSAGEISLADGRKLYVNRALGHSMRVRFDVRPEITVFQLLDATSTPTSLSISFHSSSQQMPRIT